MHWRLGVDIGTNSIGWWAFRVEREGSGKQASWRVIESVDGGVHIFSDGREPPKGGRVGDSRAVGRRMARGMRRNRDRARNRLNKLVQELISLELLPNMDSERNNLFKTPKKINGNPEQYNPYRLRSEALERALHPYELGRVFLHMALRRGFSSNRREASDEDGGKLKERISALHSTLEGRTLGQYLWQAYQVEKENQKRDGHARGIRFRSETDFYPERVMYASEFDAIRANQEGHHKLSSSDWTRLRDRYILFQWPLRPVERGYCEFFSDQSRHWKDTPIGHDFRIYQEINALRWIDENLIPHALEEAQRSAVLELLRTRKSEVTFSAMRREKRADGTALFPKNSRFNLEDEKRKGLNSHRVAAQLLDNPLLSVLWESRNIDQTSMLDDIYEVLHGADNNIEAASRLTSDFGLSEEMAKALTGLNLASGTANVSRKFMERIVPVLRDQGLVYSDAVAELDDDDGNSLHHSLRDDGRRWQRLPYYGEVLAGSMLGANPKADPKDDPEKHFGKINNPTVHVALNRLRKLINTLVERFGSAPVQVHIELVRDLKLSRARRDEITLEQSKQKNENERIKKFCAEHGIHNPSYRDIKKVKLWEELNKDQLARQCPFSGQNISAAQLFNGDAEIEHLLPFSRTLDDSMRNLTVAMRWANRLKSNDTPYEAFHGDRYEDRGIVWSEILQRIEKWPLAKRKLFGETAMQTFERDGGFIARQLIDTAYMSKVALRYVKSLEGVEQVVPNPGRLTALARGKWGFNGILGDDNRKSRDDHRHHAIDAAVVGLTDRAVLSEISRLTARGADDIVHLKVPELDEGLRAAIRKRVSTIIVSFKPDHGLQGKMFKETALGFVNPHKRDPKFPEHGLVARKPLVGLTYDQCQTIRDINIRNEVLGALPAPPPGKKKPDKKAIRAALIEYSKATGHKRVRILITDQTARPIPSAPYKQYVPDSYVCCDIWRVPKGKLGKWKSGEYEWKGMFWAYAETVSSTPDSTRGKTPDKAIKKPHPAAKFLMRLFKDDMIAYEDGGQTQIMRVGGFSTTNNRLDVRPHHAADAPQKYVGINVLGAAGLRKLHVSTDGVLQRQRLSGAS